MSKKEKMADKMEDKSPACPIPLVVGPTSLFIAGGGGEEGWEVPAFLPLHSLEGKTSVFLYSLYSV